MPSASLKINDFLENFSLSERPGGCAVNITENYGSGNYKALIPAAAICPS